MNGRSVHRYIIISTGFSFEALMQSARRFNIALSTLERRCAVPFSPVLLPTVYKFELNVVVVASHSNAVVTNVA